MGRFDVAERGSDWFVGESLDLRGKVRGAVGLTGDYAYKPLVFYDENGNEKATVIDHQLFLHLGGSLNLWNRLRLGAVVPIAATTIGNDVRVGNSDLSPDSGPALGDVRLGVDLRIVGEYEGPAQLAVGAQVYLPTGDRSVFTGDGGVRIRPRLMLAGDIGPFAYSARAAFEYRSQDDAVGGVTVGNEVLFAATAGFWLANRQLLIGPELWGSTVVEDGAAFDEETTPFEVIFGAHYRPGDWRFGLGGGPGLTRGVGAPAVRVLASIEWAPAIEKDRDHDGIFDKDDACPDLPGPRSSNPKENGCPIRDRDRDTILDDVDACPDVYGMPSDDPKRNGCPPPGDRDGDGVFDDEDACPDVPGVKTDDPATNGCPGDTDGDGILDPEDACPRSPGPRNEDPEKNGCPIVRIEKDQIKILERIEFETDSARILPVSDGLLLAVRDIIKMNPQITKISVEGHTDNVGGAKYNKGLSERRAASVVNWLVSHGVEPSRLQSVGYGLERPIDVNTTAAGRQKNRRVEFHILEGNPE